MNSMQPVRELVLDICRVASRWHYQVYYIFDGKRFYYEIWGKQFSEYYSRKGRIEQGASPLEALNLYHLGYGY
jgi:hypothetical protein